jgi:hypothetical protein
MIETFPLRFLLIVLAGWVNRQQLEVIDFLRKKHSEAAPGGRRLRLTDCPTTDLRFFEHKANACQPDQTTKRKRIVWTPGPSGAAQPKGKTLLGPMHHA